MNYSELEEGRKRIAEHFLVLPTVETKNDLPSPTRKNPNKHSGGVLFYKALSLESEKMVLYVITIVFSIILLFFLGFYFGKTYEKQRVLESRISLLEKREFEQKNIASFTPEQVAFSKPKSEERRIPQSSVLRNKPPQQIRKEKEKITSETIEREMLKMAREFGGGGSMEVI